MNEQELERHDRYLSRLLSDPSVQINDLVNHLERDEELADRILHKANSAVIGSRRKVSSLHQAIILLGFRNIKTLIRDRQAEKKTTQTMEKASEGGF